MYDLQVSSPFQIPEAFADSFTELAESNVTKKNLSVGDVFLQVENVMDILTHLLQLKLSTTTMRVDSDLLT